MVVVVGAWVGGWAGGGFRLTTHEGHGTQRLLHEDLCDGGQVVVRVVRHDDPREQDGHDACSRGHEKSKRHRLTREPLNIKGTNKAEVWLDRWNSGTRSVAVIGKHRRRIGFSERPESGL